MDVTEVLRGAVGQKASDIFFIVGQPVAYKIREGGGR